MSACIASCQNQGFETLLTIWFVILFIRSIHPEERRNVYLQKHSVGHVRHQIFNQWKTDVVFVVLGNITDDMLSKDACLVA